MNWNKPDRTEVNRAASPSANPEVKEAVVIIFLWDPEVLNCCRSKTEKNKTKTCVLECM